MPTPVLALDLERTLVSDALSARPRPGVRAFLEFCDEHFARVALFTSVETADARGVMAGLVRSGHAPAALVDRLEYVDWSGAYKDLAFVSGADPAEVVLVDDDPGWVHPDQADWWVRVAPWDGGPDRDLERVRAVLAAWAGGT